MADQRKSVVQQVEAFRRSAAEARESAEKATTSELREAYHRIAEEWLELAVEILRSQAEETTT